MRFTALSGSQVRRKRERERRERQRGHYLSLARAGPFRASVLASPVACPRAAAHAPASPINSRLGLC